MSPDGLIVADHVWKRFRPDRRRTLLRDEIQRIHERLRHGRLEWHWVLRDINLRVEPGDSLALVGNNGSGKSTLLKILNQVMFPYAGRVQVAGRVGALIEVSSGIHPDLSGRENVILYGSFLGLPRRAVAERFDQIVEFAQLEHAIDRQVKFYSSGMKMRLGFGVAAFLEPDILLVDEVLAVGDAAFQQRCLERMQTVLGQGTTLVFVSHDLGSVEAICRRAAWLQDGVVTAEGDVRDVLGVYRRSIEQAAEVPPSSETPVRVLKVEVTNPAGGAPATQGPVDIAIAFDSDVKRSVTVYLGVSEGTAHPIFVLKHDAHLSSGQTELVSALAQVPLPRGRYFVWITLVDEQETDLLSWRPAGHFDVVGPDLEAAPLAVVRSVPVHVEASWEYRSC